MVVSLQTLSSVARKSATFDEPSDLVSGYLELTRGQYWLKPETLPLVKLVAAAPLLLLHVRTPPLDDDRFKLYDRTLYEFNDGHTLLMVARAAVLPFSLGLGCLFFLTVYALFRLVEEISISRTALVAAAFALAVVTKLSMLVLVPLIGLLGLIVSVSPLAIPLTFRGGRAGTLTGRGQKLAAFALVLLVASVAAYVVIWATYRFADNAAPAFPRQLDCPALRAPATVASAAFDWLRRGRVFPEPYLYNFFEH